MTSTSARSLNAIEREARRQRFIDLREKFKRERPGEKWVRLLCQYERSLGREVSEKTIYDVLSGRR